MSDDYDHMLRCTHRMDNCVIIREAEQVAILVDHRRARFHYSIALNGWNSCATVNGHQYADFVDNPQLEMRYIQQRVKDLRSLQ